MQDNYVKKRKEIFSRSRLKVKSKSTLCLCYNSSVKLFTEKDYYIKKPQTCGTDSLSNSNYDKSLLKGLCGITASEF